jgi:tetratricopeptide (TPR) repeat protein
VSCLSDRDVVDWLADELPPPARELVADHLVECADCLALVSASGQGGGARPVEAESIDAAGRYEMIEEIAAGGMGRIYLARDRVLDREVAVKLVRDTGRPQLAERLRREIAIGAQLQHSAIVPVFDAGTSHDGEPFFVMPRVVGRPLDQVIDETPPARRLALLPSVTAAALAVAHAHERGIVHRDLKPQNILLSDTGEIAVIDWGLALAGRGPLARTGAAEGTRANASVASVASVAVPDVTEAGAAVGTPAYMAPEQLDGRAVDARTDVYGLGGVLMYLLTGAAPHPRGRDRVATAPSVGGRSPDVSAELATIVDRALAADPDARYPSARELADDLVRFTTGKLVRAHAYTPGALIKHWVSRHRALVGLAAASLVLLIVVGAIGLSRTVAARSDAERARELAVSQRASAEELVRFALGDLRDQLDSVGRLDLLSSVGARVNAYYNSIAPRQGSAGATDMIRQAGALCLLSEAARFSGKLDEAESLDRQCLARALAAHARAPSAESLETACMAHSSLAETLRVRSRTDDAARSLADCAALAESAPPPLRGHLLARALADSSLIARGRGDLAGAEALLARAQPLAEAAIAAASDPKSRRLLLFVRDLRGSIASDRGNNELARTFARESVALVRTWRAADPSHPDLIDDLASVLNNLARAESAMGDATGAAQALEESRVLAERLVARDGNNLVWLRTLISAVDAQGQLALEAEDITLATPLLERGHELSSILAERAPTVDNRRDVAAGDLSLGMVLEERGDIASARDRMDAAAQRLDTLVHEHPERADLVADLATALLHQSRLVARTGDRPKAMAIVARAIEIRRSRAERSSDVQAQVDLIDVLESGHELGIAGALAEAKRAASLLVGHVEAQTYADELVKRVLSHH